MDLGQAITRKAIEYAEQKVPYRHRGTSRTGCDCTGLIVAILKEIGFMKEFVLRQYKPDWNKHAGAGNMILEELDKVGFQIDRNQVRAGDIAVMWMKRYPGHCGIIVAEGPVMVHSLKTERFCKKSILKNSGWSSRWKATYRIDEKKLCGAKQTIFLPGR